MLIFFLFAVVIGASIDDLTPCHCVRLREPCHLIYIELSIKGFCRQAETMSKARYNRQPLQ